MTELNFQELAKQGNPEAIASWLQSQLQSEDITVTVNLKGDYLEVFLDASPVPAPDTSVDFVRKELTDLQPKSIRLVKVEGREIGQAVSDWSQEFILEHPSIAQENNPEKSLTNTIVANQENLMETAKNMEATQPEMKELENRLRSTFMVVGMVTGILAIAVVAFVGKLLNEPAGNAGKNLEETTTVATVPDPFREAVNSAVKAAELGRAAKTKEEWNLVANNWQEAISLMRRVPQSSPHHELAQTKVAEYQKYLIYAQESAVTLPSPTPTTATGEKESAEKSAKKSNSEKETTEKSTKKSNSEKEATEKSTKKSNSEKEATEKSTKKSNSEKESNEKANRKSNPEK
ncbi:MAG: hypothetical protein EAZ78_21360 [Oscillatoriales cyanobacterium]|nr:MAG: hypothetical protein EA000_20980 [Oscillatoriales cyanobacterium]TAD94863.1 MAG: hypothetical protein EAZ98_17545 [Oscillatoriales cyanobacterium]TAE01490.1 MAG: hypothetical protein EAZ96_18850 [Oscillatoriales cyanobacterium]TAE99759.1 MAG: hypothetical protein EAZ78_21360 [Oscillatoriales cyanobacterium]TAF70123.1 MAG: hypothetical protein EAZ59_05920 [Oscillatoriales cyanobacterium]